MLQNVSYGKQRVLFVNIIISEHVHREHLRYSHIICSVQL